MEKRRPTYNLKEIRAAFDSISKLRMTITARKCVVALGLRDSDIVCAVQGLSGADFYKSMTTYSDYKVWQDVYHVKYGGLFLYIKFMKDSAGYLIVSFKEK